MINIDLTPIFQAIIMLLAALITYKLIPWIKERTTETQQNNLNAIAKVAVFAAEQLYGAGQGDKKLEYCREVLQAAGFDVNTELLRAVIENAVHNMPENIFKDMDEGEEEPEEEAPGIDEAPPDGGEAQSEE